MDMYERIKKLRIKLGMSQDELAEKVGYTNRSSIGKVEAGAVDLSQSKILAFAKALNTTPQYLMGFEDDQNMYSSAGLDYINVPLYDNLCCGNGGFVEDNIVEFVPVPSADLNLSKEYFCQYAQGDSMKDAGIIDHDLLIFEKTSVVNNNDIGCFCIDENVATCKKYRETGEIIALVPMNSNYDPIVIDVTSSSFRCLGKLKKSIREY